MHLTHPATVKTVIVQRVQRYDDRERRMKRKGRLGVMVPSNAWLHHSRATLSLHLLGRPTSRTGTVSRPSHQRPVGNIGQLRAASPIICSSLAAICANLMTTADLHAFIAGRRKPVSFSSATQTFSWTATSKKRTSVGASSTIEVCTMQAARLLKTITDSDRSRRVVLKDTHARPRV